MDRLNKATRQDHAKTVPKASQSMMNGAMMPNNCSTGQEVRAALKASKAVVATSVHRKATGLRVVRGAVMTP